MVDKFKDIVFHFPEDPNDLDIIQRLKETVKRDDFKKVKEEYLADNDFELASQLYADGVITENQMKWLLSMNKLLATPTVREELDRLRNSLSEEDQERQLMKDLVGYTIEVYSVVGDWYIFKETLRDEASGYVRCFRTLQRAKAVADQLNASEADYYITQELRVTWDWEAR